MDKCMIGGFSPAGTSGVIAIYAMRLILIIAIVALIMMEPTAC
jgi:hypothetical protein